MNGYATGVSSTPLDIASAGQIFARSAVETRLAEIEANKLEVDENVKKALKAMSITTIKGLTQDMRVRYEEEMQKYRKNVWQTLRDNDGKLSVKDEMKIQDGFNEFESRQANDVFMLEQLRKTQNMVLGNLDAYNPKVTDELYEFEQDMSKGKAVGNPMSIAFQNMVPMDTGAVISKYYGDRIKAFGKAVEGKITGNIFEQTEYVGLVPDSETRQLTEEAVRARDEMLADPRIKHKYLDPDGSINPEKYDKVEQEVEDIISWEIGKSKEHKPPRSPSSSSNQIFAAQERGIESVQFGQDAKGNPIEEEMEFWGIMSLNNVPTFTYGSDKVLAESVVWYPVAKNRGVYEKKLQPKDRASKRIPPHKNLLIPPRVVGNFDPSEYEIKPFAKLYASKSKKLPFGATREEFFQFLQPGDWNVRYEPMEGNTSLKAAVAGRMGTRGDAFVSKLESMNQGFKTPQPGGEVERMTKDGKIAIFDADTQKFIRWK